MTRSEWISEIKESNRQFFMKDVREHHEDKKIRFLKKQGIVEVETQGGDFVIYSVDGFFKLNYAYRSSGEPRYSKHENYSLTYSFNGHNWMACAYKLAQRENVAVVFNCEELPKTYRGWKVINGDETDLRFLDKKGVIVGLLVKGHKAKKDSNAFIVEGY